MSGAPEHAVSLRVARLAVGTAGAPHVRDAIDVPRLVRCLLAAALPTMVLAVLNTGRQASLAMAGLGHAGLPGWRGALLARVGLANDPASPIVWLAWGLALVLPTALVALVVATLCQHVATRLRGTPASGAAATAVLFVLALPPAIAPWQVALGIAFGLVVGREIFGGTGRNFVHPALAGLAFLHLAYPEAMRGDGVWVAVSGWTAPAPLGVAADGGVAAVEASGLTWAASIHGWVPGAIGGTSALTCAVGAALLLHTRAASWRILAGGVLGLTATASAFVLLAPAHLPMATVPWYWHLTLGSFAFGLVFFATDPVTAATTDTGRWIYGLLVGAMTVVIRVANPLYDEGVVPALLLANVCAPLIDYAVVWANVRRRRRRDA